MARKDTAGSKPVLPLAPVGLVVGMTAFFENPNFKSGAPPIVIEDLNGAASNNMLTMNYPCFYEDEVAFIFFCLFILIDFILFSISSGANDLWRQKVHANIQHYEPWFSSSTQRRGPSNNEGDRNRSINMISTQKQRVTQDASTVAKTSNNENERSNNTQRTVLSNSTTAMEDAKTGIDVMHGLSSSKTSATVTTQQSSQDKLLLVDLTNSKDDPKIKQNNSLVQRYIRLFSAKQSSQSSFDRDSSQHLRPHSSKYIHLQHSWTTNGLNPNTEIVDQNEVMQNESEETMFLGDVDECTPSIGLVTMLSSSYDKVVDTKLEEMNLVLSKRLVGISLQEFYDTCWSESDHRTDDDNRPFFLYGSWLQSRGHVNVMVPDWEFATTTNNHTDPERYLGRWCQERYTQRRLVTYQYSRTTDLHCGRLDAIVQQLQMCRMDGSSTLILATTVDTKGIPFADKFQTQIRWVITQIQPHTFFVKIGVVIQIVKPTILAGKLRLELLNATASEQLDLFRSMKATCDAKIRE